MPTYLGAGSSRAEGRVAQQQEAGRPEQTRRYRCLPRKEETMNRTNGDASVQDEERRTSLSILKYELEEAALAIKRAIRRPHYFRTIETEMELFAQLQQRVVDAERELTETKERMSSRIAHLEDIVRATTDAGTGDEGDVWVVSGAARFAIAPTQASAIEYFAAALRFSSSSTITVPDMDSATFRIFRICMQLGRGAIGAVSSSAVSMELPAMISAIRLSQQLLMPWMATALALRFEKAFRDSVMDSDVSRAPSDDDGLAIAFQALALAQEVQDLCSDIEEDQWSQVQDRLTATTTLFVAQHISFCKTKDLGTLAAKTLGMVLLHVENDAWSEWATWDVPDGQEWVSEPNNGFVLEVQTTVDSDVGVYVKEAYSEVPVDSLGSLYQFQAIALTPDLPTEKLHSLSGWSGLPVGRSGLVQDDVGWGWADFMRNGERRKYLHMRAEDKQTFFRIAIRTSYTRLHKQFRAVLKFVQAQTEYHARAASDAVWLGLALDYVRTIRDPHGADLRAILLEVAGRAFEVVICIPRIFSSLTLEEIANILARAQSNDSRATPQWALTALWVHGLYRALEETHGPAPSTSWRLDQRTTLKMLEHDQRQHLLPNKAENVQVPKGAPQSTRVKHDGNVAPPRQKSAHFRSKAPAPLDMQMVLKGEEDEAWEPISAGLVVARATC